MTVELYPLSDRLRKPAPRGISSGDAQGSVWAAIGQCRTELQIVRSELVTWKISI
jgi:hypothetical protein